jgi:hypothetical protein
MNILVAAVSGANFNHTLHYRYTDVGEVLSFLQQQRPQDTITFYDSLAYQIEWNLLRAIASDIDVVIFFADVASAPATLHLATLARDIVPDVKMMVYGKATLRIPHYFTRPPFDAVYIGGDQEAALLSYLTYLDGGPAPCGVWCARYGATQPEGIRLAAANWGYPLLAKLPLTAYRDIAAAKDIPFELSVYPSKGCPYRGCDYCDAALHEGQKDRRRHPEELLLWTAEAVQTYGFACVQMHSTNFCVNPAWVEQFCEVYQSAHLTFPWTCCTRPNTLNREIIQTMAQSGCVRIGIGIETIPDNAPVGVKTSLAQLEAIACWIAEAGISCKAYMMAGMPGQTECDLLYTYLTTVHMNFIPRVSTYTPFHQLRQLTVETLDRLDLARYDRKSFLGTTEISAATILKLVLQMPDIVPWAAARYAHLQKQAVGKQ